MTRPAADRAPAPAGDRTACRAREASLCLLVACAVPEPPWQVMGLIERWVRLATRAQ